jgi:mRNA interferase MazF
MTSRQAVPYQFGDVLLVRFPFTSQTAFKQRPAVVVSNAQYNRSRPDVVVLAITSQFGNTLSAGDLPIADWQHAGLLKPSAIKPVFATIEQTSIVRRLGTLQQPDVSALRPAIASMIG